MGESPAGTGQKCKEKARRKKPGLFFAIRIIHPDKGGRKRDFFDEMGRQVKTSCEEWCVAVDRGSAGRYTKNHAYITDGGLAAEGGME